ncbi:unnamed protein product [Alopecurus aequalis]
MAILFERMHWQRARHPRFPSRPARTYVLPRSIASSPHQNRLPPLIDNQLVPSVVSIRNPASARPRPLPSTRSIHRPQLVAGAGTGHRSPPPKPSLDLVSTRQYPRTYVQSKPTMTTTDSVAAARRFAVACGVLSQYVKAGAAPAPVPADGAAQQLTIFYGGRVVVLNGCTPARAAELIRYAAAAASPELAAPVPAPVDIPIARKASLQRFLSKRKDRSVTAVKTTCRRDEAVPPPAKKGKTEASSWLALGSLGDMHAK